MKKRFCKLISVFLCMALCISAMVSGFGVAVEAEAPAGTVNLVSGQNPILFAASTGLGNVQSYNFNSTLRYWGVSGVYKNGYTPTDETTKSEWIEDRENNAALSEHRLSYLTDNNSSTYMGIQPPTSGYWSVVAYKFDPAIISSLSILSQEKNDYSQRIVVYISDSYNTLLTTESIVYGGDGNERNWATEINIDSINQEGSYIAIATKERGFSIREISVYGEMVEDINADYEDILTEGQVPVQFSAAGSLANIANYNDRTLRYFPASGDKAGYSPANTDTKDDWSGYVANMSDNNDTTGTGIRQQYSGDYLAIVYQIPTRMIKGYSISSFGTHASTIHVYVSNSYSTIFDDGSKIFTGTTSEHFVNSSELSTVGTYIAFVTNDREFTINEIAVYTEPDVNEGYDDMLAAGQTPAQFSAAGSFANIGNYNDRTLRYFPVSSAWHNGYSPANIETRDTWSGYLANMTDNDILTGTGIRQQYNGDYVAIVYQFDFVSTIKGFRILSAGTHGNAINVYVSKTYSGLFDNASKVYTGATSDDFANTAELNASGKYIAFVTTDRDFTINEISVYGFSNISHSLVLTDAIGVNFLVDLSDMTAGEKAATYMTFAITNQETEQRADFADTFTSGEKYGFTCFVSSVQMAEAVTPTFHYGNGETVTMAGFSVKDYIDYVVAHSDSFDSTVVDLVKALGDYGHYMQTYLGNKNEWVAGTKYTVIDKYRASDYTSVQYDAYLTELNTANVAMVKEIGDTAVTGVSYNLNFDSTTYINVKLATSEAITASAVVNDRTIYADGNGQVQLRTQGLPILKLGDAFTVTGSGSTNTTPFSVTLSGLSYIRATLRKESEPVAGAKNAVSALYGYYRAACVYQTMLHDGNNGNLNGEMVNE